MPDNSRLAKLIEQRKRHEKQNDRIRVHKNKLDHMRLEKLSNYYDRNKQILKQQHLTAEAKCVKRLEKIYNRQCKIEDEKKERDALLRKEGEEVIRKTLQGSALYSGDDATDDRVTYSTATAPRRRVASAGKQERAKSFMSKAKSLSAGYRDNDPPQSYYKRKGLVPPERLVTPEISFSAQAQTGGGFGTPASAFHVKNLRRWRGIPDSVTRIPLPDPESTPKPQSGQQSPQLVSRQFSLTESLKSLENEEGLDVLQEENESCSGNSSKQSSNNDDDKDDEQIVVNIRPSTAPVPRALMEESQETAAEPMSARDAKDATNRPQPQQKGPLKSLLRRPSTASPGVPLPEVNESVVNERQSRICFTKPEESNSSNETAGKDNTSQMRRQSSSISFAELPKGRRRSSVAPPLALLHRRQSNVAAIHKSIERNSNLFRAKSNKMKKKSGSRMGLMQSVMTNAENEILVRKLKEQSRCLAEERRTRSLRAQSAPVGGRKLQIEENCPNILKVNEEYQGIWAEGHDRKQKNKGQKALIKANVAYSDRLGVRVRGFLQEQQAAK